MLEVFKALVPAEALKMLVPATPVSAALPGLGGHGRDGH